MVIENMSLIAINANSPYEVKVAQAFDTLCFIRKDNPQFADLVSKFMATVNLLNTKPEDYCEE